MDFQPIKRAFSSSQSPRVGCPDFRVSSSLHRVRVHPYRPFPPYTSLLEAQLKPDAPPPPLFFSYLVTWRCFLQFCLYRSSNASFQLVFHLNYSTCRCIFSFKHLSSYSATLFPLLNSLLLICYIMLSIVLVTSSPYT